MSEQLDRIEALLTQLIEGQVELKHSQQTMQQQIIELQQGQSEIRSDIARVDARVDALDTFVHRAADDVAGIAVAASTQASRSERAVMELVGAMQGMRGSFQAHIEHTDRVLEYLMRRLGPESAA